MTGIVFMLKCNKHIRDRGSDKVRGTTVLSACQKK